MKKDINISWKELIEEAAFDGLVSDIVINGTSIDDWINFFDLLKTSYRCTFIDEGVEKALPEKVDEAFFEKDKLILINLGQITIESIISDISEIELFIVPASVADQAKRNTFFEFLSILGRKLQKNVSIMIEQQRKPLIVFSPEKGGFFDAKGIPLENSRPN